jgi:YD repeat-containing protein
LKPLAQVIGGYFRSRGWKDLIFLAVVIALGIAVRHWEKNSLARSRIVRPEISDYEKWKARPKLDAHDAEIAEQVANSHTIPCFFIVPPKASGQPVTDGSVGDCVTPVPDGRKLDFFEVFLGGSFIPIKSDLFVPDTMNLAFTRTYFPVNAWARKFQIFLPHVYDLFMTGSRNPFTYVDWTLPNAGSIHYHRVSPGTGYADAVFADDSFSPPFAGSKVAWNGFSWDLALEDGVTYLSPSAYYATRPQQCSIVGIFNKDGDEIVLRRKPNGDLMRVISPSGKWIGLEYDSGGRLVRASDSSRATVEYDYDSADRLQTVRYSGGQVTKYSYDSSNRMIKVEDSAEGLVVENEYSSYGAVVEQTLGDGRRYYFHYGCDRASSTCEADIMDATRNVTKVLVHIDGNRNSYTVEEVPRGGR